MMTEILNFEIIHLFKFVFKVMFMKQNEKHFNGQIILTLCGQLKPNDPINLI